MIKSAAGFAFFRSIQDCPPELIKELNPVTWFERLIREAHEYKIARLKIERKCAKEAGDLKLQLTELEARKAAFMASLDHQIKELETANAPIMETLNALFKNLDHCNTESVMALDKILTSAGKIDNDILTSLIKLHTQIFSRHKEYLSKIAATLDNHHTSSKDRFESIARQISENTKALGKG